METTLIKYLNAIEKGDKISLVVNGMILEGTLEEIVDNCVVLTEATSPTSKKKEYHLMVPLENIYAWGQKQKKKK